VTLAAAELERAVRAALPWWRNAPDSIKQSLHGHYRISLSWRPQRGKHRQLIHRRLHRQRRTKLAEYELEFARNGERTKLDVMQRLAQPGRANGRPWP